MPAGQTYKHASLEISVEGDLEDGRTVYFTDQSPTFGIKIENNGQNKIYGKIPVSVVFEDAGTQSAGVITVDLDPYETTVQPFEVEFLPYQENARIVVDRIVGLPQQAGEAGMMINTSDKTEDLYTFSVWDRDFYKVNYLWPRYAQYASAGLAVLIILVSVIQILAP